MNSQYPNTLTPYAHYALVTEIDTRCEAEALMHNPPVLSLRPSLPEILQVPLNLGVHPLLHSVDIVAMEILRNKLRSSFF